MARKPRSPGKIEDDVIHLTLKYDNGDCSSTRSFMEYASVFNYKERLAYFEKITY